MPNQTPIGVLVGVDGSPGSDSAVRYGALEARRTGTDLTLVHVVPDYVPLAPMRPLVSDDLARVGRNLLGEASKVATPYTDGVSVHTLMEAGATVAALVAAASRAERVVLGRNTRSLLHRVFTGTVTAGVASRAACPVVSVPDTWDPDKLDPTVVVGFKDSAHEAGLLERGFEIAAARGDRLRVVHAWELPGGYDDIIMRRTHDADWNALARAKIERRIEPLRKQYPALPVEVQVVHAQPAHALVSVSGDADLLVMVRRGNRMPGSLHLGGTARAVLREASCPVEVLPALPTVTELDELDLERAGGALK